MTTTNEVDPKLSDALSALDHAAVREVSELIVENDTPVWTTLMRFGLLIRKDSASAYNCARVYSITRKGRLELGLQKGKHTLMWDNAVFHVEVQSEDAREWAVVRFSGTESFRAFESFIVHARAQGRRKGIEDAGKLVVKVLRNGVWRVVSTYPKRALASVITGDDTPQRLLDDMEKFQQSEDEYLHFGNPFKRNYMIIGPPGSGKSSLITAAASTLDHDIHYLTVTPTMTESELCAGVCSLSDKSILVIEDVDGICEAASSGSTGARAAVTVFTNVLDGTLHKHGLITILTSTTPDGLDDILMRHGRIDYTARMTSLTKVQVAAMVRHAWMFHMHSGPVDADLNGLVERIWKHCETLDASSTILAQFLFRHRGKSPSDITDKDLEEIKRGTHRDHVSSTRDSRRREMYM